MQINPMPHKSLSNFNHNEIYIEYTKRCSPLILLDQKPLRPNFNDSGVPIPLNGSRIIAFINSFIFLTTSLSFSSQ